MRSRIFRADLRGKRPGRHRCIGQELLEHLRIAQREILDFSADPNYKEGKKWPDDYWPPSPAPPQTRPGRGRSASSSPTGEAMQKLTADNASALISRPKDPARPRPRPASVNWSSRLITTRITSASWCSFGGCSIWKKCPQVAFRILDPGPLDSMRYIGAACVA